MYYMMNNMQQKDFLSCILNWRGLAVTVASSVTLCLRVVLLDSFHQCAENEKTNLSHWFVNDLALRRVLKIFLWDLIFDRKKKIC